MISSSPAAPTETTAAAPVSQQTTLTPLGKDRTPSLARSTSLPTRLKSTLFSEVHRREKRGGDGKEKKKEERRKKNRMPQRSVYG